MHYPEYKLVLEDTHIYYNLPLEVYTYEQGVLGIQIPVFPNIGFCCHYTCII